MNRRFISFFAAVSCAFVVNATNDEPAGFSVLAEKSGLAIEAQAGKSNCKIDFIPGPDDIRRGFIAELADTASNITDERQFDLFAPKNIRLFGTRGEYRNFLIAVRALKDLNELNFRLSNLVGAEGNISSCNINIRRIVTYKKQKGKGWLGHFLEKDFPFAISTGNTAWIWGTVFIPEQAQQGTYKGVIEISNGDGNVCGFPLNLSILDFQLRGAAGNWGVYMPGHFADDKSGNRIWSTEYLKAGNLDAYFKFWKSIRFNSPFLCHVYPGLELVDGKVKADFTDISKFAISAKKNSMDGFIIIDTRFIQWWANVAAQKYEQMKAENKDTSVNIGVKCSHGVSPKKGYSPFAIELYTEAIKQLLYTAEKEKWPDILLLPEEEIGNGGDVKPMGYETFTPVLKKLCPDKVILVDNDIGYGRKNAIDRGGRDNIKYRQYNSWEESALEKAKSDGATIWGYNYGFSRAAYGFLQQRLGSTGYHQWAEHWGKWTYSLIVENGIISSIELEQSREGRFDYDYCNTFKIYMEKLAAAGHNDKAKRMNDKLIAALAEIPVSGPEFGQWRSKNSSRELDSLRWMIVMEIQNARRILKEDVMAPLKVEGQACLGGFTSLNSGSSNVKQKNMLQLPYLDCPVTIDGSLKEAFWHSKENSTGPLVWTKAKEIAMRAYAASEEEFKKMPAPSYSRAALAYDNSGIYIGVRVNHVSPETDKLATRSDDDAELWRDNCMEFFFRPSDGNIYHLIVNTRGNKVLMLGSKTLDSSKIKIATKGNVESSGGSSQEIYIPWQLFGLSQAPVSGTTWLGNIGREYHPMRQFTTWSKVYENFWEIENWGLINFTAKSGLADIDPDELCLFPGKSRIKGHISFKNTSNIPDGEILLSMKNSSNEPISSVVLTNRNKEKALDFSMEYFIPSLNKPEEWSFELNDKLGRTLSVLKLPVAAFKSTIEVNRMPLLISSGNTFPLDAMLCVGNLDISDSLLKAEFVSKDNGKVFAVREIVPSMNGECRIWVDSSGIPAGKYVFRIWLSRKSGEDAAFEKEMEVLPPY